MDYYSDKYISWDNRRAVASGLKNIYLSPSEEADAGTLDDFVKFWDSKYPAIFRSWKR